MSTTLIETKNTVYLFDGHGHYQRRPLRGERDQGELYLTMLAGGALDDEVWLPMEDLRTAEHPAFPGEVAMFIVVGPSPWDYVQTTPVTDPELLARVIENELWHGQSDGTTGHYSSHGLPIEGIS